jgi:Fic family protein
MLYKFLNRHGLTPAEAFDHIQKYEPDKLGDYLRLYNPLEDNGKYLYFDKYRFKIKDPALDHELAWLLKKLARRGQLRDINGLPDDTKGQEARVFLTPTILKAMHIVDRHASAYALESMHSNIGEETHVKYLLNDLIQDESISSSQLEGAATTTVVAKEMISRDRQPRSMDEKMILGNFKLMNCAWEHRNSPLSPELIKEFHEEAVKGIDDEKYQPGQFRTSDDVVITDYQGDIVHQPPPYESLDRRIQLICVWINSSDANQEADFLHPLLKAIVLHFFMGHEHPFKDGNGRVARALFYWFMFKSGYSVFRYISISVLLKKAPRQYANSYIYVENDEFDLTYFIDYQCAIIIRAINNLRTEYFKALHETEKFNEWLWSSNLYGRLNSKQRAVFQVSKHGQKKFTINEVKYNLNCSYNTAANVLNSLVKLKIFKKDKRGKEWIYSMVDKDVLVKDWK